MAILYVKSTGSNTAPYDTWAKASTTLLNALSAAAPGDTIYCYEGDSEGYGAETTFSAPTDDTNPIKIIVTNDAVNEPPQSLGSRGGYRIYTTTGDILLEGFAICWGLKIDTTSSGSQADISIISAGPTHWYLVNCWIGGNDPMRINWGMMTLIDCTWQPGTTDNYFLIEGGVLVMDNVILDTTIATPNFVISLFQSTGAGAGQSEIKNCDFSGLGIGQYLVQINGSGTVRPMSGVNISRCLLGSGVGYILETAVKAASGTKVNIHSCTVDTTNPAENIARYEWRYQGTSQDETAIYRAAAAPDQATGGHSVKISTTRAKDFFYPLKIKLADVWVTGLDLGKTFTVHIVHDSATNLQDDEVWIEVVYPDNTTSKGLVYTDRVGTTTTLIRGNPFGTPADQPASTEVWTGTAGFVNENKQKLEVTVPSTGDLQGKEGVVSVYICLATSTAKTIYACPKIEIA